MKKGSLKNIISSIGKEKTAYHYSDSEYVYLSESHFILRCKAKDAQYVIDEVNKKKRAPQWRELERLPNFFKEITGELCTDISEETLSDGRNILALKTDSKFVKINKKFCILENSGLYINGKREPVYEIVGEVNDPEAVVMILPINF